MTLAPHWQSSFRPRDRRPIYEWAHDNLYLAAPYTITGHFSISNSRHFIEPFDALQDDRTSEVNVLKPVRGGGSLIGDIYFAWCMAVEPGPFLNVFQTEPVADSHWEDRLKKLLLQVGVLPMSAASPGKHAKFKRDEVRLENGFTCYNFGPSINNLQSRALQRIRLDELWLYDGMLSEAEGRLGDYKKQENSKLLVISQGGPKPGLTVDKSEWHGHFYSPTTEINEWTVQCAGCGKHFQPKFFDNREDGKYAGICWDKDKLDNGRLNVARALETVRFESPCCGHPHTDFSRTKSEWNRTGKYELTNDANAKKRSFHWEAIIDFPWRDLVDMWLDACASFEVGVIEPKIAFYQKYCAKFADEQSVMESATSLTRVKYEILTDKKYPGELGRVMAVDKQEEDEYWWTVRVWFEGGRSIRIGFGSAIGYAALEDLRIKHLVAPNHLLIDSAFVSKGESGVYAACIKYGWLAVRGSGDHYFVHKLSRGRSVMKSYKTTKGDPECGFKRSENKYATLVIFSKPTYNRRVQELIDRELWEEPVAKTGDEMEKQYSRQMSSRFEIHEYHRKTNEERTIWREGKNDHARDLANIIVLFASIAKLLPDISSEPKESKIPQSTS